MANKTSLVLGQIAVAAMLLTITDKGIRLPEKRNVMPKPEKILDMVVCKGDRRRLRKGLHKLGHGRLAKMGTRAYC